MSRGQKEPILHTIRQHYQDPQFNATALADMLERSLSYLCEQSYTHYGMSLHQLIETVRLEQAVELLAQDGYKIEHVRRKVGYTYSKTFRTVFKKRLGMTPKQCATKIRYADDRESEIAHFVTILWEDCGKKTWDCNNNL